MPHTDNLTIMFTDMVGFTERTSLQSRTQNQAMLRDFNRLMLPVIARFGGHRIKSIGDALLVTFRSPTDGVRCGMALHDALADFNRALPDNQQIHIRVAVNVGEVQVEGRDIFGEAVNVASRVEGLTPPGEVYFTEAVYLAMNKAEVSSELLGEHKLKGIPELVKLFRVPPRQVLRLTTAGEDLGESPGEYPFGGLHKLPTKYGLAAQLNLWTSVIREASAKDWYDYARSLQRRTVLAGSLVILVLGVLIYWTAHLWPAAPPKTAAPQVSAQANPAAPASGAMPSPGATEPAQPPQPDPERLLASRTALGQAQRAWEADDKQAAIRLYDRAMEMNPDVRNDPTVAARLVQCLGMPSEVAGEIIRQNPSRAMIDELARRTSGAGVLGRKRAASLLRELGQEKRVDAVGMALMDLQEGRTCQQRLESVQRLRKLRDPRSLPALKEVSGGFFSGLFKNRCLTDEASAAVQEIETAEAAKKAKKPADKKPADPKAPEAKPKKSAKKAKEPAAADTGI